MRFHPFGNDCSRFNSNVKTIDHSLPCGWKFSLWCYFAVINLNHPRYISIVPLFATRTNAYIHTTYPQIINSIQRWCKFEMPWQFIKVLFVTRTVKKLSQHFKLLSWSILSTCPLLGQGIRSVIQFKIKNQWPNASSRSGLSKQQGRFRNLQSVTNDHSKSDHSDADRICNPVQGAAICLPELLREAQVRLMLSGRILRLLKRPYGFWLANRFA
jgi:hypothetical protein